MAQTGTGAGLHLPMPPPFLSHINVTLATLIKRDPAMHTPVPQELKLQIEQGYDEYVASKSNHVANEPLRDQGQTFADAMCEASIVDGVSNGQAILDIIKKAGVL
jgi:hypothetical protein